MIIIYYNVGPKNTRI